MVAFLSRNFAIFELFFGSFRSSVLKFPGAVSEAKRNPKVSRPIFPVNLAATSGVTIERGGEDVDALEKERPLLFKKNRKALIGGNHRFVRFNVGKIGIQSETRGNVGPDSVLHCGHRFGLTPCVTKTVSFRRLS